MATCNRAAGRLDIYAAAPISFVFGGAHVRKSSTLEKLRSALANQVSDSEYALGIHAYYDGEIIFGRDIVQNYVTNAMKAAFRDTHRHAFFAPAESCAG